MSIASDREAAITAPFGTVFADQMAVMRFEDGAWSPFALEPFQNLSLSPAAHVLHYSSTCFEGLKAHRRADGVYTYRLMSHMRRFRNSAGL